MNYAQLIRWTVIGAAIFSAAPAVLAEETSRQATEVRPETARRMTEAHQTRHPKAVRAHYFGREVVEALLARPKTAGLSVRRAIDDRGKDTVLLVPLDREGRYAFDFVGDASNPCPPCDPEEDPDESDTIRSEFARTVGDPIPRAVAERWMAAHRARHPEEAHASYFDRATLDTLLSRPRAEGLLVERAIDAGGRASVVMSPLDAGGKRIAGDVALPAPSRQPIVRQNSI